MHTRLTIPVLFIALIAFSCKKSGAPPPPAPDNEKFVRSVGNQLIDSTGNPLQLRGVAFGNQVWSDNEIPLTHHDETDFIRVKSMHMNAIRFYLNYKTFESDNTPYQYNQSGWNWLETNIAWAKKHGVYLILNMHYPQGGYQSGGTGDALWNNLSNQDRLTALWREIARRYGDETTIAGYGLVNEPVPVQSLQQWQQLAQKITDAIRQEDRHHTLFIEKPIYIKQSPGEDDNLNFPTVNDNNIAYEFHHYDPHAYTHQLFSWANTGDGGSYPDDNILSYTNGTWYTATFNNPQLPAGNTGWTYFEGEKYLIADPKISVGMPALVAAGVQGTVYFDDITITEFDEQGNETAVVMHINLNNRDGWNYWSSNNTGNGGVSLQSGSNDDTSLYITGGTGDGNMSNYTRLFLPKQNYAYRISGWMKGENVQAGATCMLRIDFIHTTEPVYGRNKDYLRATLRKYADFSAQKNVPLYLGEFGAGSPCFQNNKGGLLWVNDMLDLITEYRLHFTYHAYHESSFGLYFGDNSLPDPSNANQPLIDLFTEKLD